MKIIRNPEPEPMRKIKIIRSEPKPEPTKMVRIRRMELPDDDVPLLRHRDAVDTELISAQIARPRAGTQRVKILMALAEHGPMIGQELTAYVGKTPEQTHHVSPAMSDLRKAGWIRDTGKRRLTLSKCPSMVVEITDEGREVLAAVLAK